VMPGGNAIQPRFVLWCITIVAVGLSLFQLYSAGIQPLGLFYQRSIHLALIMLLAFLMFPAFGPNRKRGVLGWGIDLIFFAGALITGGYLVLNLDAIFSRAGFWNETDILVACIATVTVLEASSLSFMRLPAPVGSFPGWASGCPASWSTVAIALTA